ncbi:immunity repressor [Rhodococcus phage Whack]|uniref:Immunity repressor n=2 Tax=root TaxID=1 RepID=A0A515MKA5_9CAUD|nr:immunity repressor [Rhodococcus phage Whack]QDM57103.1 immunity repressor [Rhodococcus phage Whack]
MTTTERPTQTLRERISANVLTLMPSRGLRRDHDLAELLGWTTAKTSRCLRRNAWQLDDLDHLAEKLGVNVADLTKSPYDYLPRSGKPTQPKVRHSLADRQPKSSGPRSAALLCEKGVRRPKSDS